MPKKVKASYGGYLGLVGRYMKQLPKELITDATPALEDAVRFKQGQGRKPIDIKTDPTDWSQFLTGYGRRKKRAKARVMGIK